MVPEMIRKILAHLAFGAVAAVIFTLAYWAADREPPSHYIASWIMTRDVYPGEPIAVRIILVRRRLCSKRIEQSIDDLSSRFPLPPRNIEMPERGLDVLTIEEMVPEGMAPGIATYRATFIWRCPGNPVHLIRPITLTIEHEVIIK